MTSLVLEIRERTCDKRRVEEEIFVPTGTDMFLNGEETPASSAKVMMAEEKLDHCSRSAEEVVVMGDVESGGAEEILLVDARNSGGLKETAAADNDVPEKTDLQSCSMETISPHTTTAEKDAERCSRFSVNEIFEIDSYQLTSKLPYLGLTIQEELNSGFSLSQEAHREWISYPDTTAAVDHVDIHHGSTGSSVKGRIDENLPAFSVYKSIDTVELDSEIYKPVNQEVTFTSASCESSPDKEDRLRDSELEMFQPEIISTIGIQLGKIGNKILIVAAEDKRVFSPTQVEDDQIGCTFIEEVSCYDVNIPQDVGEEDRVQAKDKEVFDDCDETNVVVRIEISNKNPRKTFPICKEIDYQIEANAKSEVGSNKQIYEETGIEYCSLGDDLQSCEENDLQVESNVIHEHTADESSEELQDQTSAKMADDEAAVDCDGSIRELDSTEVSKRNASCSDEVDEVENESLVVPVINHQIDVLTEGQWSDAASADPDVLDVSFGQPIFSENQKGPVAGVTVQSCNGPRKGMTSISIMIPSEQPCPLDVREHKKTTQFTSQDVCSTSRIDERKTNKEITLDIASCTTSETPHTPLKNLLVEANLASKQKGQTGLQWIVAEEDDVYVGKETCSNHQFKNRSSSTRTVYKEWNSPARLPPTTRKVVKEKSRGKPQWVPLICCSYVDQPLRKNFS